MNKNYIMSFGSNLEYENFSRELLKDFQNIYPYFVPKLLTSNDLPLNILEWQDFDQDGIGDNSDSDDDNDGVIDSLDDFPLDATRWTIDAIDGTNNELNTWDFDQDGNADALTDGLLLLRYTFGLRGSSLSDNAIATTSSLTPAEVESKVSSAMTYADIDDSGNVDALTDGLMLLRYLFGLRGTSLINLAVAIDANRSTAVEIETYIESMFP